MTFVGARSDDVFVPLVPGGAQKKVTEENLEQYCELAEAFRCREFDAQVRVCVAVDAPCCWIPVAHVVT